MKEEINITFDEFGWRALEDRATQHGIGLEALLGLALTYYVSELPSGRAATAVPRFRQAPANGDTRTIALDIDEGIAQQLEQEAERRGVALERVYEHAALFFLADLDAGRVAEQVVRRARSESDPTQSGPGSV
jgi:hypothetical protein